MIIYVFDEYRDRGGIGNMEFFKTEADAVKRANDMWLGMNSRDRKSYETDSAAWFRVYEADVPEDYNDIFSECNISECETRSIKDYLRG